MTIFELMAHYLPHADWRARLGQNAAAAGIALCWGLSLGCVLCAFTLLVRVGDASQLLSGLLLVGAGFFFVLSLTQVRPARHQHEVQRSLCNPVLFAQRSAR